MTRFFPIPPQLSWSRELLWVLSRACARAPLPPLEPGDASLIVALARRLEVSGRIAARLGKEACRRDLGELAGESLYDDLLTNVAVASALLSAQRRVQASATRHGISVAWLKFAGLHAAGLIREGSRVASDID